jgi:hypothetical protein
MRFRHDPAGRRLPIKLDTTSNGEFAPIPLDTPARHARLAAADAATAAAKRLAVPRRAFLVTAMGAAATLAAMGRAFAAAGATGGAFDVPAEAAYEPAAAAAAVGGDEFIFDVQLHHVNPNGAWRTKGNWGAGLRGMPNAKCGAADYVDCFSAERMLKDVFLDSDTAMAVLSHVPAPHEQNPLDFEAAGATREAARALDGSERLLLHGRVLPNLPGELERMDEQATRWQLAGFKTYTQFGPGGVGYFLDDDVGVAMIERARRLGVRNICVHKGIPFGPKSYEHSTCRDVGVVAKRFPDMNFLVYHSGFEPGHAERPWDPAGLDAPQALHGIDTLIASLELNGRPRNVYAELGSTWRFAMRRPDLAAHVIGKLLRYVGEDRVLWGTDSIWYGSPQDQIQAFRAFRIADEFREKYGYPELTPAIRRKIFGLNAARVYGVDAAARAKKLARDGVAAWREAHRDAPDPAFETYGPRTRREFLAFRRLGDGTP